MGRRALVLTGSLGMGHHVITEVVTGSLEGLGFSVDTLDCMELLGRWSSRAGDWVFRRMLSVPSLYDALHFAHLRPGGRVAGALDAMATRRLVPALARELAGRRPDLVVSTFATGASAAAKLASAHRAGDATARSPWPTTVVLCTDVTPHRLWVQPGVDLFLVTSPAAAAAVRRYEARAQVVVVPPPVRAAFGEAPDRQVARRQLGVAPDARCVLLMGGGWGLGPLAATAGALAAEGVTVLAVAGNNRRLHRALRDVAAGSPGVVPYGYVDNVPVLMAAADLVLTTPGATTCSEARAMRRPLVLLDVVPGHGRDNVQHELELGDADVCDPQPSRLTASVLAALDRIGAGHTAPAGTVPTGTAPADGTGPSAGTAPTGTAPADGTGPPTGTAATGTPTGTAATVPTGTAPADGTGPSAGTAPTGTPTGTATAPTGTGPPAGTAPTGTPTGRTFGPAAWEEAFAGALAGLGMGLGPGPWPPVVPSMAGGPAGRLAGAGATADPAATEEAD